MKSQFREKGKKKGKFKTTEQGVLRTDNARIHLITPSPS